MSPLEKKVGEAIRSLKAWIHSNVTYLPGTFRPWPTSGTSYILDAKRPSSVQDVLDHFYQAEEAVFQNRLEAYRRANPTSPFIAFLLYFGNDEALIRRFHSSEQFLQFISLARRYFLDYGEAMARLFFGERIQQLMLELRALKVTYRDKDHMSQPIFRKLKKAEALSRKMAGHEADSAGAARREKFPALQLEHDLLEITSFTESLRLLRDTSKDQADAHYVEQIGRLRYLVRVLIRNILNDRYERHEIAENSTIRFLLKILRDELALLPQTDGLLINVILREVLEPMLLKEVSEQPIDLLKINQLFHERYLGGVIKAFRRRLTYIQNTYKYDPLYGRSIRLDIYWPLPEAEFFLLHHELDRSLTARLQSLIDLFQQIQVAGAYFDDLHFIERSLMKLFECSIIWEKQLVSFYRARFAGQFQYDFLEGACFTKAIDTTRLDKLYHTLGGLDEMEADLDGYSKRLMLGFAQGLIVVPESILHFYFTCDFHFPAEPTRAVPLEAIHSLHDLLVLLVEVEESGTEAAGALGLHWALNWTHRVHGETAQSMLAKLPSGHSAGQHWVSRYFVGSAITRKSKRFSNEHHEGFYVWARTWMDVYLNSRQLSARQYKPEVRHPEIKRCRMPDFPGLNIHLNEMSKLKVVNLSFDLFYEAQHVNDAIEYKYVTLTQHPALKGIPFADFQEWIASMRLPESGLYWGESTRPMDMDFLQEKEIWNHLKVKGNLIKPAQDWVLKTMFVMCNTIAFVQWSMLELRERNSAEDWMPLSDRLRTVNYFDLLKALSDDGGYFEQVYRSWKKQRKDA